ncbi:MAG: MFS transporter [Burkholderiaceae bacterium]
MTETRRSVALLLNIGHALDHMFLLIFATAVTAMAAEFGRASWEDLMPFSVGAFVMFGLGSLPSGRLGDLWGRRRMMLIFFFGIGVSSLLVALTHGVWQLACALTLLGAFASIYHPVGIPMLVQNATKPGLTIGINGLAGNLGIAFAALITGFLVKYFGWRTAFIVPGLLSLGCGVLFLRWCPPETEAPAKRANKASIVLPPAMMARVFAVMTATAITGSLLFNLTTNGNAHLLRERFVGIVEDPASLGALLAAVYAVASVTQVLVGRLIDRYPFRRVYLAIVVMQVPLFVLASGASGWSLFALQIAFMAVIFGAIPFTDAMIFRYVDDALRSRVSGMRLAVAFGGSSLAVWALGPAVKAAGFQVLLLAMAAIACLTVLAVSQLPAEPQPDAQPAPA